jgi:phospholipid-transporting ATPase
MITAANVGVGLSGNEGAQAARAADFAIGQFRFLQRLLLVHGRESYRKNAVVVSYNFYKNSVLVLPSFLYGFAMAFSGQPFYEQILYQVYNVLFTFWPDVFYAILDRSAPDLAALQEEPSSYADGRCQQYFNSKVFMLWIGAALLQGCLLTVAGIYSFSDGGKATGSLPTLDNMWLIGTAVYFWVVLGVNLTLLMRLKLIVPATVIVTIVCATSFPFCTLILDVFGSVYISGVFALLFGTLNARFILVSVPLMLAFLMIGEPLIMMCESALVTDSRGATGSPRGAAARQRRSVA